MQGGNHMIITILEIESAMTCSPLQGASPAPIKVWKVGGAIDIYNCCCSGAEAIICSASQAIWVAKSCRTDHIFYITSD